MASKSTDIDDSDIHFMYEVEGMTYRDIADYYGVCLMTIYYRLHPEKQKKRNKQWYLEHADHKKEYYLEHKEEFKERSKRWQLEHPEYDKQWWQTDKGKAYKRKVNAVRRNLGSIELNKPFPGSEFHHIDKYHGIHVPGELHQSIRHNVWNGQGMEVINKEAFEFLEWEMREKQWEEVIGDWIKGEY